MMVRLGRKGIKTGLYAGIGVVVVSGKGLFSSG